MRILLSFVMLFSVSVLLGCGGGDADTVEETAPEPELTEEEVAEEMELDAESNRDE